MAKFVFNQYENENFKPTPSIIFKQKALPENPTGPFIFSF